METEFVDNTQSDNNIYAPELCDDLKLRIDIDFKKYKENLITTAMNPPIYVNFYNLKGRIKIRWKPCPFCSNEFRKYDLKTHVIDNHADLLYK